MITVKTDTVFVFDYIVCIQDPPLQENIVTSSTSGKKRTKKCAAKGCCRTNTKFFTFPSVIISNEVDEFNLNR